MGMDKMVCRVSMVLVIIGALNMGIVGVMDMNVINMLLGDGSMLAKVVHILVGLAGLYMIYMMIVHKKCMG